jgi:hypothetical protein
VKLQTSNLKLQGNIKHQAPNLAGAGSVVGHLDLGTWGFPEAWKLKLEAFLRFPEAWNLKFAVFS